MVGGLSSKRREGESKVKRHKSREGLLKNGISVSASKAVINKDKGAMAQGLCGSRGPRHLALALLGRHKTEGREEWKAEMTSLAGYLGG